MVLQTSKLNKEQRDLEIPTTPIVRLFLNKQPADVSRNADAPEPFRIQKRCSGTSVHSLLHLRSAAEAHRAGQATDPTPADRSDRCEVKSRKPTELRRHRQPAVRPRARPGHALQKQSGQATHTRRDFSAHDDSCPEGNHFILPRMRSRRAQAKRPGGRCSFRGDLTTSLESPLWMLLS